MTTTETRTGVGRLSLTGVGVTAALVGATALAADAGRTNLVVVAWAAFLAMALAAPLGARAGETPRAGALVWGYGLSSGAMVTSAAVFLLPTAIGHDPQFGGFGVALGLLLGFAGHTVGHRLAHVDLPVDRTVAELTAHALAAGVVIGVVYANMEVGALLGLAIVSHKGPAGYAAATRLSRSTGHWSVLLVPAAGVGLGGVAAATVALPAGGAVRGVVFGFATGVFLHVAMDFLPRCEIGSEVHEALADDDHALLDRLRTHAVASTVLGGLAVFLAWVAVSPAV
jgi:ZIP family zinc transporter